MKEEKTAAKVKTKMQNFGRLKLYGCETNKELNVKN